MTTTAPPQPTIRQVHELAARLPAPAPMTAVQATLATAMRDLRGSISEQALPEMAFRLAHYRLTGQQPTGTGPGGRVAFPAA